MGTIFPYIRSRVAPVSKGTYEMLREPLAIEGFYATRLFARRTLHALWILALVAGCLTLSAAALLALFVNVFLVSWSLS